MDALDVELDPFNSGFAGPIRFDELEPFVIDPAGFHVGWRQARAAAQLVVAAESGLRENSMHRPAATAAVGCEAIVDQGLLAMNAARH